MYESIFSVAGNFAIAGWLLLLLLPRWKWTRVLVMSGAWPALLSVLYLVLIAVNMPGAEGGFGSLVAVRKLFDADGMLLAGWVHYLAFDLLVWAIELRIAQKEGIPHLAMVPILFFTFMLGPVGFLAFLVALAIKRRRLAGLESEQAAVA
jgi:hypothetical protein